MSPLAATAFRLAALAAVTLTASPGRALPVMTEAAAERPDTRRVGLETSDFTTVAEPGQPRAASLAAAADPEVLFLAAAGSAAAGSTDGSRASWSPADWSAEEFSAEAAGLDDGRMFELPVNELFALPGPQRIDVLPEPGLLGLLGAGLIGAVVLGRRRGGRHASIVNEGDVGWGHSSRPC